MALEYIRGEPREDRRFALLVLAFGAPARRTVDDLVIAARIDHLKLVIRYAAGERSGIKVLDRWLAQSDLVSWWQQLRVRTSSRIP